MPSLFDPIAFGDISLSNRVVMAPLTRGRAGPGRIPNAMMATYYAQRATAGMIVSEATAISKQGYGFFGAPALYDSAHVEGWRHVTEKVHEQGGKMVLQLWHMGRVSHPDHQNGELPVGPSPIAATGNALTPSGMKPYVVPRALSIPEISGIVDDFAHGATLAMDAGFDGVEIHAAHGYLLDQFIRDCSNKRTDSYGGSAENRIRLVREVVEAVGSAVGFGRTGIRISPTTTHNGMSDSDPLGTFTALAEALSAYRLAYLHVREDLPEKGGLSPFVTPHIRKAYNGPLLVNGGYDQARAEKAVAEKEADAVAFGMPYISNPDLVQRFRGGMPLAAADPSSLYGGGEAGYTDYPQAG